MFQSIAEAVLHHAAETPDKLALADDSYQVTYSEYADIIRRYASCFKSMGVTKGGNVVLEACQTIDYLAMELALQLIGAVFVPLEHNCAEDKLFSLPERIKAQAVVADRKLGEPEDGYYTYEEMLALRQKEEPLEVESLPSIEDVSEILFSTGTTGKEKGIVLTHRSDIALAENVMYGVEMEKDNVEMIPSPMNHSHGLRRYYANMYNGCSVVLLGTVMDIKRFFANIDKYGVNSMDLVPAALSVVLKLSKGKLAEYKDRLRYIQLGSAPLSDKDRDKVIELLPETRLYNFYGSTESGCTCIYNFNRPETKDKCIGRPTHNTTAIIVDDDHNPIESSPERTGLLATKGGMNMNGYWNDIEETRSVFENGIMYSNDIAYIDEDGDIILLGRKGDVINVGGNKVSPDEIEDVAKTMPGIADCGCIPVSDPAKGSVPKLFIEMKKGCEFNSVEIRSYLKSKLEPYKVPAFIEEIEKIPRTFNGKLLRKNLK